MIQARRILVAVHGDPTDDELIALACLLAKRSRAEIIAIYITEVKRTLPLDADLGPETARGEAVLDRAERTAEALSQEIQTELLQARDAGTAIVDEATERGVDLIIMGMRYQKRFGEFDLGTVVPYVLKHAPCRVCVVRAPM